MLSWRILGNLSSLSFLHLSSSFPSLSILLTFRVHEKYLAKLNDIYLESQETSPLIPTRSIWRTLYFISGYGGFCQLFYSPLTATAGGFGFKELFLKFCDNYSVEISQKARFCNEVIQLQFCEVDEVSPSLSSLLSPLSTIHLLILLGH
jgi:hypothetical protein